MSEELDIDPEMVAEINEAVPDIVVLPDRSGLVWFEMMHAAIGVLGLAELHAEHCLEPQTSDPDVLEKAAQSAEALFYAIRSWLQEHGVPKLSYWYSSTLAGGDFFHAEIKGTEAGSYGFGGEDED